MLGLTDYNQRDVTFESLFVTHTILLIFVVGKYSYIIWFSEKVMQYMYDVKGAVF